MSLDPRGRNRYSLRYGNGAAIGVSLLSQSGSAAGLVRRCCAGKASHGLLPALALRSDAAGSRASIPAAMLLRAEFTKAADAGLRPGRSNHRGGSR